MGKLAGANFRLLPSTGPENTGFFRPKVERANSLWEERFNCHRTLIPGCGENNHSASPISRVHIANCERLSVTFSG